MPTRFPPPAHETVLKYRFGATIRRYRRALELSQEELAWRAGIHRTYLADVERGARNLSLSSMARLISAIGVSFSEFFFTFESQDAPAKPAGARTRGRNSAQQASGQRNRRGGAGSRHRAAD